jgi:hypothetical protein
VEDEQKRILESAVRRCRRVADHSLCRDREQLHTWSTAPMTIEPDETGTLTLTQGIPDEEPLESLAARVRPFTLGSEPIHHEKIVGALREYVTAACPEHLKHVASLAEVWANVNPYDETGGVGYYIKALASEGAEESPDMTAARVGLAWIYGDLVHADDLAIRHGETAARLSIAERYRAAGILVTRLAFAVICTLNVMTILCNDGHLSELDKSVWDEQVVVGSGDRTVTLLSAKFGPVMGEEALSDES